MPPKKSFLANDGEKNHGWQFESALGRVSSRYEKLILLQGLTHYAALSTVIQESRYLPMRKNNLHIGLAFAFLIAGQTNGAWAATVDTKAAQARYESDKKLCNDETSSSARLQCRRDAKAEYDQAIAAAKSKAATTPAPRSGTGSPHCKNGACANPSHTNG
jgi:hypothetical protein